MRQGPHRLGDILTLEYGKALPKRLRDETGSVAVAGSNGVDGYHTEHLVRGPGIVVGRKGSAGKVTWFEDDFWPIDTTYYVEPQAGVDLRWCMHLLTSLKLDRLSEGAAVPGLNRNEAYKLKVPKPSVREQQRLASILDQSSLVQEKHQVALAQIEALLQSTFAFVVGAQHPDFERWPLVPIARLAAKRKGSIRSGPFGSALRHSEFVDDGIAVLGIDNAVKNRFSWDERRYITEEKYQDLKRYRVFPGDVIVTIMGTTGRSAVVPRNIPEAITTKHLATITLDQKRALPDYLAHALHRDPFLLGQVQARNRGAIMAGLNLGIIRELEVRLPPLNLQQHFTNLVAEIEVMRQKSEMAVGESSTLFNALLQRAFCGDL